MRDNKLELKEKVFEYLKRKKTRKLEERKKRIFEEQLKQKVIDTNIKGEGEFIKSPNILS